VGHEAADVGWWSSGGGQRWALWTCRPDGGDGDVGIQSPKVQVTVAWPPIPDPRKPPAAAFHRRLIPSVLLRRFVVRRGDGAAGSAPIQRPLRRLAGRAPLSTTREPAGSPTDPKVCFLHRFCSQCAPFGRPAQLKEMTEGIGLVTSEAPLNRHTRSDRIGSCSTLGRRVRWMRYGVDPVSGGRGRRRWSEPLDAALVASGAA